MTTVAGPFRPATPVIECAQRAPRTKLAPILCPQGGDRCLTYPQSKDEHFWVRGQRHTFEPLHPLAVQPFPGRPPNFVHTSETKGREALHVSENESGPAQPDRQRFPHAKGSVAPAPVSYTHLTLPTKA